MRILSALLSVALLAGCSTWMPGWSWFGGDAVQSAQPGRGEFVVTLSASRDPNPEATRYCEKTDRYPRLASAVRSQAADLGDDTITWTFDCIN